MLQAILLLIVWIHGCLGVHFWLRLKPFYPRAHELLLSIAVLLPALALLGYYQGGEQTVGPCRTRSGSLPHVPRPRGTEAQAAALLDDRTRTLVFLAAALAAAVSARAFAGGASAASARSSSPIPTAPSARPAA